MLEKWLVNNLTSNKLTVANAIVAPNASKEIKVASIESIAQDSDISELLDTGKITISRYIDDILADTFSSSSAYGLVYARKKDIDDLQEQIDNITGVDTDFFKADGSVTMTGNIDMGANEIRNAHSINIIYINAFDNGELAIHASTTFFGVGAIDTEGEIYIHSGTGKIRYTSIPTYANNAAAVSGGLEVGTFYKTTAGELRIVV